MKRFLTTKEEMHSNIKRKLLEDLTESMTTISESGCSRIKPEYDDVLEVHDIVYEHYKIKGLQHHKETTKGLFAFDKNIDNIFENIPDEDGCKTAVEAYLVQQINYLKSIIHVI